MNVFDRTLEIIGEHGWAQGGATPGAVCLEQALAMASAELHPWAERWHYRLPGGEGRRQRALAACRARHLREQAAMRSACEDVTGPLRGPLRRWNDDPARSEEDIRLALKHAAATADRTGRTGNA